MDDKWWHYSAAVTKYVPPILIHTDGLSRTTSSILALEAGRFIRPHMMRLGRGRVGSGARARKTYLSGYSLPAFQLELPYSEYIEDWLECNWWLVCEIGQIWSSAIETN